MRLLVSAQRHPGLGYIPETSSGNLERIQPRCGFQHEGIDTILLRQLTVLHQRPDG